MKILINTPSLNLLGGVANHYLGLRTYWTEQVLYNTVGKRNLKKNNGILWLPLDIILFIYKLLAFKPDIVLLNPSLGANAIKRDCLFMNIAHSLGFKVAFFIHGFDWKYAQECNKRWIVKQLNKTSVIFVLAKSIKNEIESWGVTTPIALSTTKVDDELIRNFNIQERRKNIKNILFLARIEENKGIYTAIECYKIIKEKYKDIKLTIVGSGGAIGNVIKKINDEDIKNVNIAGRLSGTKLIEAYKNADIYIFPSYHGEGMPTSVLEAMAFGLPIITRKVGGLPDFFTKEMGHMTTSNNPEDFAEAIIQYIESPELAESTSYFNASYAKQHFMASYVAKHLELILKKSL